MFTRTGSFTRAGQAQDLTAAQHRALQEALRELRPGHCRVFVQRGLDPDTERGRAAPGFAALLDTLELAQRAGATVNLTWWGQGPYALKERLAALEWPNRQVRRWPQARRRKWPRALTNPDEPGGMPGPREKAQRFARIVLEARRRFPCVTHATIQNEPNGRGSDLAQQGVPHLSMRLYERLYRDFVAELRRLPDPQRPGGSLREAITVVAGDLVERGKSPDDDQDVWIRYLCENMERPRPGFESVLDAYSIHLYWTPAEFPAKLERRLAGLERLLRGLGSTKPVYVTELGVRRLVRPASLRPGLLDGVNLDHTAEAAFQHAWLDALAPQHGCAGLVKWVAYRTDLVSGWGLWGLIDAPSGDFATTPAYRVTRLFNDLVRPGWRADGLARTADGHVLASRFSAPDRTGESLVVLNRDGRPREVRVSGLPEWRRFEGAVWNDDGAGTVAAARRATADGGGAVIVTVPPRGLTALATHRLTPARRA